MGKVLVVYCSKTGNTRAAAEAVADGAREAGAEVTVKRAAETEPTDLLACNGVAFGSYDAFSYMGGELKDCFDRLYYPVQDKVTDKPCVAFLTHGGKGAGLASIEKVASAFKLSQAAKSVAVAGLPDAAGTAALAALGAALAMACAG